MTWTTAACACLAGIITHSLGASPLPADNASLESKGQNSIKAIQHIETIENQGLYPFNRPPLSPSPLLKLPVGSITPRGWLRHMLEIETEGMTGRLKDISPWLKKEANAWADHQGRGHSGWEELPYWLKGFGDLGYVLNDSRITQEARGWIEDVLASQREDGWFGPRELLTSLNGKPDLWPHMVMLNVLQSFYDYTGDTRILPFMTRYFQWEKQLPATAFGEGYWPKIRAGDNIESLHWLYNRTGEAWLLDLARTIHENMADWKTDVIDWHNVNIAQGFRAPAVFFPQGREPRLLEAAERNYQKVMGLYGQFPGGGLAGDENCRPGFNDPRQGFETCGIVEFMHSFQMLMKISGNPIWADRCEEIAFNSFPAAMTPDQKALHYLTGANMVQLDRNNKSPGIQNGGTMLSYSPYQVYRCCQHNVSHGWPYYAEELWHATTDKGLCASLYAASEVKAKVANGTTVTIAETSDYPFGDTIQFAIATPQSVAFPLYLRVPQWCKQPMVTINGKSTKVKADGMAFIRIDRLWQNGDSITLKLPMTIKVRTWAKNKDSVSVDYGPLTFALKIDERWEKYGNSNAWPEWEVYPTTPWNYGLVLNSRNPSKSFEIVRKAGPIATQPFTHEGNPIELRAKARRIPAWQFDRHGLVAVLQPSPVRSEEPVESVTLVPMGAARLRISSFPVIGKGTGAHDWQAPSKPKPSAYKASASHVFSGDTIEALGDDILPAQSNDQSVSRFTWWDHRGTTEWVQYDFDKPMTVKGVSLYWFDDEATGGHCRVPASWRVLSLQDGQWTPVTTTVGGLAKDKFNPVTFTPVKTKALRIEVNLQPNFSGGILEWQVNK